MKISAFIKTRSNAFFTWIKKLPLKYKIILLIVVLACGWFTKTIFFNGAQQPTYQTAVAEKGTLITSVTASGVVSSGSSANITTGATGIVKEVYVANGDTVTEAEKIAEITLDKQSEQKQAAAWASYLSAKNSVESAQAKLNSLQSSLFKANQTFVNGKGTANPVTDDPNYVIQKADWQQAELDYKNQQDVIDQAQANATNTWLLYQQISSTITAPISGMVSNLALTPGLAITNSTSNSSTATTSTNAQSVGTITIEGNAPQATVNLSEIDVTKVAVGQKITITMDAFPDKTFTGKVSAINTNGITSSGVTSYPVTITFDTSLKTIYPNMAVNATIITNIKNDVVLVPSSAVQTNNGDSIVRVMKNGQISDVSITIGESNDTQTEITSGISEGDIVVTGQTPPISTSPSGQTASPFSEGFGARGFGGAGGGGTRRGN